MGARARGVLCALEGVVVGGGRGGGGCGRGGEGGVRWHSLKGGVGGVGGSMRGEQR